MLVTHYQFKVYMTKLYALFISLALFGATAFVLARLDRPEATGPRPSPGKPALLSPEEIFPEESIAAEEIKAVPAEKTSNSMPAPNKPVTVPVSNPPAAQPKIEPKSALGAETKIEAELKAVPPPAIKTPAPEISAPPPLTVVAPGTEAAGALTASGVVSWTNTHRAKAGLASLSANAALARMADAKARDMIDKGYFAHVSPAGVGIEDLAGQAGYAYLLVGENLALGNFKTDQALVQGWMDSPGHRANILRAQFTEIGVAVIPGTHKGLPVWYAVQEFGKPRSDCPWPDGNTKAQIDSIQSQAEKQAGDIQAKQKELVSLSKNNIPEYNRQVAAYNELVNAYNILAAELKKLVEEYNFQVGELNACTRGG